ncbi:MAG TPA: AAA family ATPase [Ignavibacteriaceae bacterium]|nr:AAA family ATPase [Ignavibacteriaceae bacterium]
MKYKRFIIENYKGITNAIEIDVEKSTLIPLIGINECGKTTILNAIFAFDFMNDWQNETYGQLNDVINLYKITNDDCLITAIIELNKKDLKKSLKTGLQMTDANADEKLKDFDNIKDFEIMISRELKYTDGTLESAYYISPEIAFRSQSYENKLCENIIERMPYILYFDDFRELFPDEIEITSENQNIGWLPIIQELFLQTDEQFSVYELKNIEERRRKSILSQVKRKLNNTLTSQWSNFRLENKEALEIDINFTTEKKKITVNKTFKQQDGTHVVKPTEQEVDKHLLKFDIIERDSNGNEHFFYVKNRSKGFFWFFNFVMKLEFNPDKSGDLDNALYLLDEPGSYLHPYAQTKLCKKLKELSKDNVVIYCTHSHYLLNPDTIPLNRIQIVNKNDSGDISLKPYYQVKGARRNTLDTAFRTINEALFIKPFDLDINYKSVLIVEGIYDYYAFTLFKGDRNIGILPGRGADTLVNFISTMIGFDVDFKVLWDNDPSGILGYEKAIKYFGTELSKEHFYLLPPTDGRKTILQDLFNPEDIVLISNELQLARETPFEKKITSLFFSDNKDKILKRFSLKTKNNFSSVYNMIGF